MPQLLGYKTFASNKSAVLKWCLNHSELTKITKALKDLCNTSKDVNYYKHCIPSQILKTNELVDRIITVSSEIV